MSYTITSVIDTALLLVSHGWAQKAAARDHEKKPCGPTDPEANSWCLTAALYFQDGEANEMRRVCCREAEKTVREVLGFGKDPKKIDSLVAWNDDPARTVGEVLDVLFKARAIVNPVKIEP